MAVAEKKFANPFFYSPVGMQWAVYKGAYCASQGGSKGECPYSGAWKTAWLKGYLNQSGNCQQASMNWGGGGHVR